MGYEKCSWVTRTLWLNIVGEINHRDRNTRPGIPRLGDVSCCFCLCPGLLVLPKEALPFQGKLLCLELARQTLYVVANLLKLRIKGVILCLVIAGLFDESR
jgi:hypothetical protein